MMQCTRARLFFLMPGTVTDKAAVTEIHFTNSVSAFSKYSFTRYIDFQQKLTGQTEQENKITAEIKMRILHASPK
jgi:hypothetical protein